MKTTLGFTALTLLLSACSFQQKEKEIQIEPLSKQEIRAVQLSLQTGVAPEAVRPRIKDETCSAPDFFGRNIEGRVAVPEDYNNPDGRKIQVYYYGRLQAGKDPVVFYNGGPASDSHGSAQILEDFIRNPDSQKLSFIYIDQRGTGCSDLFPTDPTAETIERLSHYTSAEIVKDSEIIREKVLGVGSKWKIFGQSFGGLIVHRYAITAPDSVTAAYAHGFSLMKDQNEWLKLRVQSQKRVSDVYFKTYPNDRDTLAKIRSLIPESQCFTDGGTKVCGPKIMDALTILLGFSNSWSYMHQIISQVLPAGSDTLNQAALKGFIRNYVFGVYNSNGLAVSVISISEISGGTSDADGCKLAEEKLKTEGEDPEAWLINECRLLVGMQNDQWTEILKTVKSNLQMNPEQLLNSLNAHPNLPFYLYAGEKDVFVPVETFQEEIKILGDKINYHQFPGTGHEGFYMEKQVWSDLLTKH
jgi:pimeloyl-ACP methyl ester carboxylesterase